MHHLGQTRSSRQADHTLLTPDTFIRAPLPGMRNATAIVHASPAMGARFTQYTVEFGADGLVPVCAVQRFVYVLEGEISVAGQILGTDGYAYFPEGCRTEITSAHNAIVAVIEKSYVPLPSVSMNQPPIPDKPKDNRMTVHFWAGNERDAKSQSLGEGLEVRILLPEDPCFDFAVNTMIYRPGAALPIVESHVMEHGLLMLAGGGIYRLGDHWYPVTAGDFIYMAPWCTQWFGALGPTPAKYLIYKDWNR
jgi:(S)-ureidoglycine aminohydrolase